MHEAPELATLVADTLALLDALRRQGTDVLPVGALEGLGAAPATGAVPSTPAARPSAPTPPGHAGRPPAPAPSAPASATSAPARAPSAPASATSASASATSAPRPYAPPPDRPEPPPRPRADVAQVPPPPAAQAAPAAGAGLFGSKWARVAEGADAAAAALRAEILACRACSRGHARAQAFPGDGAPKPMLVIVTDPPDAAGDAAGNVLVGEAAQMLDRMLLNVVRIDRREVLVVPVVRCGGPGPLLPAEVLACGSYLSRQLALTKPRAVLVLGEAARVALGLERHGTWGDVHGHPALSTFHPLWLAANPGDKRLALAHLKELASRVG